LWHKKLLCITLISCHHCSHVQDGYGYAVLITDCDSGFVVFAGCLPLEGAEAQSLASWSSSNLKILKLDITGHEDVQQTKEMVQRNLDQLLFKNTAKYCQHTCIYILGNDSKDLRTLQRIVNTASIIIGATLPSLTDIFNTRLTRRAISIADDTSHPSHSHFRLLPSGRRYWSLQTHSTRLTNSFIHQAVRMLNTVHYLPSSAPGP
uniref:Uncharacterized protein n=1 Tax=Monopterus albus TaxID=43700 RepID=A0A3Q3K2F1_MONAL